MGEDEAEEIYESVMGMPKEFFRDAMQWWHNTLDTGNKLSLVALAYYEYLAHASEHADEALEEMVKQNEQENNNHEEK